MTHLEALPFAIEEAVKSPCQSKRGAVIFDEDHIISVGYNHQPEPFICDGSNRCKENCGKTAIHAEQDALIRSGKSANGASMLHVKVVDGRPVVSGSPSCMECSKLILAAGVQMMWLLGPNGWKSYNPVRFHFETVSLCHGIGIVWEWQRLGSVTL